MDTLTREKFFSLTIMGFPVHLEILYWVIPIILGSTLLLGVFIFYACLPWISGLLFNFIVFAIKMGFRGIISVLRILTSSRRFSLIMVISAVVYCAWGFATVNHPTTLSPHTVSSHQMIGMTTPQVVAIVDYTNEAQFIPGIVPAMVSGVVSGMRSGMMYGCRNDQVGEFPRAVGSIAVEGD